MSADLLRRAAAKLHEHAEKATGGPWVAEDDGLIWSGDRALDPAAGSQFGENAQYIALMHPPVASALAELLAAQAVELADFEEHDRSHNYEHLFKLELAIGREILRDPS